MNKEFKELYSTIRIAWRFSRRINLSKIAIIVLPAFVLAGCLSMIMPDPKAIPPAISQNARLEQAAINTIMSSGINAEPVEARIVSSFSVEQNKHTGLPTKRYINIVVVVRSRAVDNTCTWGNYRFSQRYMGNGSYEGVLRKVIALDSGSVKCNTMKP